MPVRVSSVDFIGRADELKAMEAALDRARDGQAGAVLLGGDAGIGKSRLVAEFERRATASGAQVLVGECVDLAGGELPYGPIVAALRPIATPEGPAGSLPVAARAALSRLWPAIAADPGAADPAEFGQGQLFEAIHALIAAAGAERPLALVIEDLQWADRSTRDLLTFLIKNARGQRIVFVVSFRSDELHRGHALHSFVTDLERTGGAERIEVGPFTPAEIAAQVAAIQDAEPDPWLASRLAERSEGNPFFAEELLAATDEGPMPESLRDALLMRVERLSPAARDVLGLASVAGRSVGHQLLAAASPLPDTELPAALREAIAHRVLVNAPGGTDYEFRHALMREAVYDDLLPGERVPLHRRVAESIEADPALAPTGSAIGELAYHWHVAGDAERALGAAIEAAAVAERRHAHAEAQVQLERALELWSRVPEGQRPDTSEAEIARRAALAALSGGEIRRAIALERRVVELSTDPVERGLSESRLGRYLFIAGAGDEAIAHYEEAVRLVPAEPVSRERAQVLGAHAHVVMISGRMVEAVEFAEVALDMARRAGARDVEASVLNTLGPAYAAAGKPDPIDHVRAARAIAEEIGALEEVGRSYINESHLLDQTGRLPEALEVGRRGAERARELGVARSWGAFIEADNATRLFRAAEWDDALVAANHVLDLSPSDLTSGGALTVIARVAAERGDFDAAGDALSRSERISSQGGPQWTAPNYAAFGTIEMWRGNLAAARAGLARALADTGLQQMLDTSEVYALYSRISVDVALRERLLGNQDAFDAIVAEVGDALEKMRANVLTEQALSEPAADYAACEAELSRLEEPPSPAPWLDMAERWGGLHLPYRVAYAQWRAAEAMIAAGERGPDVRELLDAAAATAERLGARPLADAVAQLSRRAKLSAPVADDGAAGR